MELTTFTAAWTGPTILIAHFQLNHQHWKQQQSEMAVAVAHHACHVNHGKELHKSSSWIASLDNIFLHSMTVWSGGCAHPADATMDVLRLKQQHKNQFQQHQIKYQLHHLWIRWTVHASVLHANQWVEHFECANCNNLTNWISPTGPTMSTMPKHVSLPQLFALKLVWTDNTEPPSLCTYYSRFLLISYQLLCHSIRAIDSRNQR